MPKSPISGLHRLVAPLIIPSPATFNHVQQTWDNLQLILKEFYFPHHIASIQNRKSYLQFLADMPEQLGQNFEQTLEALRNAKQNFINYRGKMTADSEAKQSQTSKVVIKNADYIQMAYDLRSQHPDQNLMMLNMANAVRMGGAVFYNKGTAEEKLCRHSDLLLSMILDHMTDPNMQRKWLTFIFKTLHAFETSGQTLWRTRADYQKYITQTLALIYEAEGKAYNIVSDEPHVHSQILLLDPSFDFKDAAQKPQFHQHCVSIQVADVAGVDLRWIFGERSLVSRTWGLTIDPALFKAETMNRIEAMIDAAINVQAKILDLSALGCGAFRNDPQVVAECFAEVFNSKGALLAGTEIHFGVFADNFAPFLKGLKKALDPKHFELADNNTKVAITPTLYAPVEVEAYEIGAKAAQGWLPYMQSCFSIRAYEQPHAFRDGYNAERVRRLRA